MPCEAVALNTSTQWFKNTAATGLVMDKFGSELWFEPEPFRTEPEVQFKVLKNG